MGEGRIEREREGVGVFARERGARGWEGGGRRVLGLGEGVGLGMGLVLELVTRRVVGVFKVTVGH